MIVDVSNDIRRKVLQEATDKELPVKNRPLSNYWTAQAFMFRDEVRKANRGVARLSRGNAKLKEHLTLLKTQVERQHKENDEMMSFLNTLAGELGAQEGDSIDVFIVEKLKELGFFSEEKEVVNAGTD